MASDWFTQELEEFDDRDAAIAQHQLEERRRMEDEQQAFLDRILKIRQESSNRFDVELSRLTKREKDHA